MSGYAPVYYPGTMEIGTAAVVRVGVSEEHLGIDIQLRRVPLATVTGQVITPAGVTTYDPQVRLLSAGPSVPGVPQLSARPARDGTFTIRSVPPGQYQVLATATGPRPRSQPGVQGAVNGAARKMWAEAAVVVDGSAYQPPVTLALQDGMTVRGTLWFDGTALMPELNRVRVTLAPHGLAMKSSDVGSISATADASGGFTFTGIVPGQYRISATRAPGWTLKSVMAAGRDVLDFWLEVEPSDDISNVLVGFGDKATDLKGTLQSQLGQPTADYTVIIFPADSRYWVPLARRMQSVRPSTDGRFSFTGLPPGEYRLAAVTDVDAGALYDPALLQQLVAASVAVKLTDGFSVVQDLRVAAGK